MSKPQTQRGYVFERNNAFHIRYYAHENGVRKQRSRKLCVKDDLHPHEFAPSVMALAETFMHAINEANLINDSQPFHCCTICGNRCKRTLRGTFA